jgi:lysophospholipase L1-like esterase
MKTAGIHIGAIVALVAVTAGGCRDAITSPSPGVPPVTPGLWVFLGSSTTAGFTTSSRSQAWVSRLENALTGRGVTIVNIALPGAVTYNWMPVSAPVPSGRPGPVVAHNIDTAIAQHPALVLLNATSNDVAASYSVDETIANVLAIRAIAEAAGAKAMVLSTQPRNLADAQRAQLALIDARLAPAVGACFVDIRTPLSGPDGRLAPSYDSGDGIHPNDAGHEVIFQRVDAALQSGLCVPAPH